MQLSKNQIDELYEFVRKKGIQYIDLQKELVGYLILIIESKMKSNPNLTFTKALNLAYKTFGVYGFDAILSHKIKMQTKLSHNKVTRQTLSSSSSPPFNSSVHPALFAFVWFCVCASVRMVSAACCLLLFLII